ncbi:MAG: phosphatidylinositol-specific phospholipase C/glycerophosphodiester phosphodiesterase family protein [Opitutaceae bacterium]
MAPLLFALGFTLLASGLRAAGTAAPVAHAHNDYEHARPLHDALERGFGSVEADIWLVDGALLVAHDRKGLRPERTLQALYLDPLRERVRTLGGRVQPARDGFTLLVDVKSAAGPTYAALHAVLAGYAELLTEFRDGAKMARAVTVIISGNRDEAALRAQTVRFAALDGRKVHLDSDVPADLVPWISENWRTLSTWNWAGPMPAEVRTTLGDWVAKAHARGRRLRFWNVPDSPAVWTQLADAGVDIIGADDLGALQAFMAARAGR